MGVNVVSASLITPHVNRKKIDQKRFIMPKEKSMQEKEISASEDGREEGEIVDDYEDIISSDEETTMRQRIEELEAKNAELEKIANISGVFADNYDDVFKKRDPSRHERYITTDDYYDYSYVQQCASLDKHATAYRRRMSPDYEYRKKEYLINKPKYYHYDDADCHWDSSRSRSNGVHKLSSKRHTRLQYSNCIPLRLQDNDPPIRSSLSNETISSTENEIFYKNEPSSYLNRDELRFAIARDTNTSKWRATKKRKNRASSIGGTLKERLNKRKFEKIENSEKTDSNQNRSENLPVIDLDEIESDDSISLEEQELRLIALKSAVIKKHIARQKRNAEAPYSPSDFDEVFAVKAPGLDDENDFAEMEISPAASPQYISESEVVAEDDAEINTKPVDMELANSDSDEEFPVYEGHNEKWVPIDQIPLPVSAVVKTHTPMPLRSTHCHFIDNDDIPPPPPPFYIRNERDQLDEETKEEEESEEEAEALRALLLSKLRSPNASRKGKTKLLGHDQEHFASSESSGQNTPTESSVDTEVLRDFLINNMNERLTTKSPKESKYPTATILKEAVRRLTNKSTTNLENEFCEQFEYKNNTETRDEIRHSLSPQLGRSKSQVEACPLPSPQIAYESNNFYVHFQRTSHEVFENNIQTNTNSKYNSRNLIYIRKEPISSESKETIIMHPTEINANITEKQCLSSHVMNDLSSPKEQVTEINEDLIDTEYENPKNKDVDSEKYPTNENVHCEQKTHEDESVLNGEKQTSLHEEIIDEKPAILCPIASVNLESECAKNVYTETRQKPLVIKSSLQTTTASAAEPVLTSDNTITTVVRKKIVKPNKVINTIAQKRKSINSKPTPLPPSKKILLTTESSAASNSQLSSFSGSASSTSRLVTIAEASSQSNKNSKLIITLRASDSDSSDDDFDPSTGVLINANQNDYYDNASPISLQMGSPCDTPTRSNSPVQNSASTEPKIKLAVVNNLFETKLDEFLKKARNTVQNTSKITAKSPIRIPTTANQLAVRHLPKTAQQEYLQLVNRMKILERQKQAKKTTSKSVENVAPTKDQSHAQPATVKSENTLIKKVLIKNANNITNNGNRTTPSKAANATTKTAMSKEKYLTAYETAFMKTGSNIMSSLDKSLSWVLEAKKAKMEKLVFEERLKKLRQEIDEVQHNIEEKQEIITKIYPKVRSSHDVIMSLKQRRSKFSKIANELGRMLKGDAYRLIDDKKKIISQKSKKLAEEIKIVNTMQLDNLDKLQKELTENHSDISNHKDSTQTNGDREETNLVPVSINLNKKSSPVESEQISHNSTNEAFEKNTTNNNQCDVRNPAMAESTSLSDHQKCMMSSDKMRVPENNEFTSHDALNRSTIVDSSKTNNGSEDKQVDDHSPPSNRAKSTLEEEVLNELPNNTESNISPAANADNFKSNECKENNDNIQTIKEYISPLGFSKYSEGRQLDPNGIICPYELMGQCVDKDCKFLHLHGIEMI